MKAITCTQALIAIAVMQIVSAAFAGEIRTSTVNNIDWTYEVTSEENKTASLCLNYGDTTIPDDTEGLVIIPEKIEGYTITAIEEFAFEGCYGITEIEMPESITRIGEFAFSSCINLTHLTIPASVTSIGDEAFDSCDALSSISILGSNITLGDGVFNYCYNLSAVYVANETVKATISDKLSAEGLHVAIKSLTQFDAAGESFMTRLSPPSAPGGKWQITAFASVADGDASGLSPGNVRVLYGTSAATATADAHARLAYVTNAVMVRLEFDHPDDAAVQYYKVSFGY